MKHNTFYVIKEQYKTIVSFWVYLDAILLEILVIALLLIR